MDNICACFHADGIATLDEDFSGDAAITNFQNNMHVTWVNTNIKIYSDIQVTDDDSLKTAFEWFYNKSKKDDKTVVACLDVTSWGCLQLLGLPGMALGPVFDITLDDVKSDYGQNERPFSISVIECLKDIVSLCMLHHNATRLTN